MRFTKTYSEKPEEPADAWEWLIALLLAASLVITTLCLGGVRAQTQVLTTALTSLALIITIIRPDPQKGKIVPLLQRTHWAGWLFLPFLTYAAINALWLTPVRWLGTRDFAHWYLLGATFWTALNGLRTSTPRRLLTVVITLLAAVAIILTCYQVAIQQDWLMLGRSQAAQYLGRASGFFGNPNTLAAFFLMLIPQTLAHAWQRSTSLPRRIAYGYATLALFLGLALTQSRGGWLALALALICWPCLVREWKIARRALACLGVIAVVALAAATLWFAPTPASKRLHSLADNHGESSRPILWEASLKMTASSPLIGTGAGSFNTLFEKYRPVGFREEPQWTHNDFLNILSDYGAIGFILFFGAIGIIVATCNHQRPAKHQLLRPVLSEYLLTNASLSRTPSIALLALAFACLVDFHLHIPAIGMLAAISAAEILKRRKTLINAERELLGNTPTSQTRTPFALQTTSSAASGQNNFFRGRKALRITSATLVALTGFFLALCYQSEATRVKGRIKIDALATAYVTADFTADVSNAQMSAILQQADNLISDALETDDTNAQAWADQSYVTTLQARLAPQHDAHASYLAEQAARKALALSKTVPEFWIRLGVALDLQNKRAEAGDAFAHALNLAPANALAWYHQAYHLALTPATRALAISAAETCLRLDPTYLNAEHLRMQLLGQH